MTTWQDVFNEYEFPESIRPHAWQSAQLMAAEILNLRKLNADLEMRIDSAIKERKAMQAGREEQFFKAQSDRAELVECVKALAGALEHIKKACLCERGTGGFDYGDVHPQLGEHPRVGARWITPHGTCEAALTETLPTRTKVGAL